MPKLESCCHEVMEGWNDIPLQETPLGISKIGQILEHCSSAGQTSAPERVGVDSAFKMQTLVCFFFMVAFVPVWDFSQ